MKSEAHLGQGKTSLKIGMAMFGIQRYSKTSEISERGARGKLAEGWVILQKQGLPGLVFPRIRDSNNIGL